MILGTIDRKGGHGSSILCASPAASCGCHGCHIFEQYRCVNFQRLNDPLLLLHTAVRLNIAVFYNRLILLSHLLPIYPPTTMYLPKPILFQCWTDISYTELTKPPSNASIHPFPVNSLLTMYNLLATTYMLSFLIFFFLSDCTTGTKKPGLRTDISFSLLFPFHPQTSLKQVLPSYSKVHA